MPEMKPIVKKVLESGLVDKHYAQLMEQWGYLPEGSTELVKTDALKGATKEQLQKLAEDIGNEVDKERALKETQLDLDKIRWPVEVTVLKKGEGDHLDGVAHKVPAVIDRMGRFYFRIQDVADVWFVPGYLITREVMNKDNGARAIVKELILEKDVLYIGEQPVCIQVTTTPV
jgi:hypothetical protein